MRNIKTPKIVLSVEEEAIVADEVNQHLMDLDATTQNTSRLSDIVMTMADVQTVVSSAPEVGNIEEQLVDAAADMAVAGTDADAAELSDTIVAAEEGVSTESVVEGIKAAVLKIWEAIKAGIAQVWKHIVDFFSKIGQFLSGTTKRIEKLKSVIDRAPRIMEVTKGKMGVFKGPHQLLLIDGRESMNFGRDFADALNWSMDVIHAAIDSGKLAMNGGVELVTKIVADPDEVNKDSMMALGAIEIPMGRLKKAAGLGKNSSTGELASSIHVMGGLHFFGTLPRWGASAKGTDESLQGYEAALKLQVGTLTNDKGPDQITLNEKPAYFEEVLKSSEAWVHRTTQQSKMITGLADAAHQASSKIDGEIKKIGDNKPEVKKQLSAVLSINGKINNMMATIIGKVFAHGTKVANAALDYSIQSCEQVPAQPAGQAAA